MADVPDTEVRGVIRRSGSVRPEAPSRMPRVGYVGVLSAPCAPRGVGVFDGAPVEVVSEGEIIPVDSEVVVVSVSHGRVEVRRTVESLF